MRILVLAALAAAVGSVVGLVPGAEARTKPGKKQTSERKGVSKMSQVFMEAVKKGDLAKVREMADKDKSLVRATDDSGTSAVLLATYYGKKDIADLLVARGAPINVFEAAATGRTDRLKQLVEKDPALVRSWSHDGFTPLHLAVFFGHKEAADYLLTQKPDINAVAKNPMKVMPLHSAAANRDAETAFAICKALVEHGADVNAAQEGGFTSLHEAAQNGNAPLVKLLLEHGGNPAAKLTDGRTPLDLAKAHNQKEVEAALSQAKTGK